ncbi:MAG: hypothetical protein JSS57_23265 [Proteobacteria bacterium]|nr:hypothetical protein [Pseudomonadota bacterium]
MADEREPKVCGVVGLLIGPNGHVWAEATDFSGSGYGGFNLKRSQEIRVEAAIARAFVRNACSGVVVEALDGYDCQQIVSKLKGFKMKLVAVGHDDEASQ